jgi:hypothetical protein
MFKVEIRGGDDIILGRLGCLNVVEIHVLKLRIRGKFLFAR